MANKYINLLGEKLPGKLPVDLLRKLKQRFGLDKLEQRERLVIYSGAAIVLFFIVFQFVVAPYLSASTNLDRSLAKRKADIVDLKLLQQEYRNLKEQSGGIREQLKRRPSGFSLFSFLDSQSTAAGVKQFISYMKPSSSENSNEELLESMVEMKLQAIGLKQLVDFLQLIESTENVVSIKRLSIQAGGEGQNSLDVILRIVTFVENG